MCATATIPFCSQNVVNSNILLSLLSAEDIFKMVEKNPSILEHPQLRLFTEASNPVLIAVYLK